MELKPKYQYTYFIKPFIVGNYKNYLIKILENEKFELKIWEQQKDLEIYSYFLPEIRNQIFNFELTKNQRERLESLNKLQKLKILEDQTCLHFEYKLSKDNQVEINGETSIYFEIDKIF